MARASYSSIIDWMDTALNPDLFVHAVAEHRRPHASGFRRRWPRELTAIPGVERVQMVRDARIVFRQTPMMVVAVEVDSVAADRAPRSGRGRRQRRCIGSRPRARGLIVSDNLAQLQHLTLGEVLECRRPTARSICRSSGIIVDYSDQQGTILMDRTRVPAILARRFGERVPRLSEARRASCPT